MRNEVYKQPRKHSIKELNKVPRPDNRGIWAARFSAEKCSNRLYQQRNWYDQTILRQIIQQAENQQLLHCFWKCRRPTSLHAGFQSSKRVETNLEKNCLLVERAPWFPYQQVWLFGCERQLAVVEDTLQEVCSTCCWACDEARAHCLAESWLCQQEFDNQLESWEILTFCACQSTDYCLVCGVELWCAAVSNAE